MFSISNDQLNAIQALSAIVSLVSFPLVLISLFVAFRQIKSQTEISRKELMFNGLMKFSDNYQQVSSYRQTLIERFALADKTLNEESVFAYHVKYWLNNSHQWNFFYSGLMDFDVFLGYTAYAYSIIAGEQNIMYFSKDGTPMEYNSRTMFEQKFIGSVYKDHISFYDFYTGLYNLKSNQYNDKIIPDDQRYREITIYIKAFMKKYNIKNL